MPGNGCQTNAPYPQSSSSVVTGVVIRFNHTGSMICFAPAWPPLITANPTRA